MTAPKPQLLPIDSVLPELVRALRSDPTLVLEAPPGAGKTTRVPGALAAEGLAGGRQILVAEPRRLAARMAARHVADERGERLGDVVGYRVRFEEVVGPKTRIVYVTEGVLLRRLLSDPRLDGVGAVVLDEFHERHLDTDLLLALLWRLKRTQRPDLVLVVMSATLDAAPVARFLGDCPRLSSEGRKYPVEIEHAAEPDDRPLEKQVVSAVRRLLDAEPDGHVLVFLPGAYEIRRSQEALQALARERGVLVAPLHGDLPITEQARAIEPSRERKVVLSTNVAESSLTIEGVTAVVDSGLARVAGHSPWTGLSTLTTAKVSRASATQRAGRAGRTQPGRVLRLYTLGDFQSRAEYDTPELLRADLTEPVLVLHGAGANPNDASLWLSPPPPVALDRADTLLGLLGALDDQGRLSAIGRRLLELPLHPRLGRIVVEGERRGVAGTTALIAALLGERDIRLSARGAFGRERGRDVRLGPSDLLELVDAFELARSLDFDPRRLRAHELDPRPVEAVSRAERQLRRGLRRDVPEPDGSEATETALLRCILAGFADRLARRRRPGGNELVLASGSTARLAPESVVQQGELLVAVDVEERSGKGLGSDTTVRLASAVRADWLLDAHPDRIELSEELVWNENAERVEQLSRMAFGAVVLDESRAPARAGPETARVLARAVETRGAREFLQSDAVSTLAERLALLHAHFPDAGLPRFDADGVKTTLSALCENSTSFEELRQSDVRSLAMAALSADQRRLLEREAPERVRLPGGRSVEVHYEPGKPPWIESRLQDFFGMADGPRLCLGRVAVTLHLLAPNARAVQVTSDLAGFWQRHYPSIRRELMRRYPRHLWPEDGQTATPPAPKPKRA